MRKNFIMGNDKHLSREATCLNYLGKKHLFHIVDNNFPLPADGIIGLLFFRKYDRFLMIPRFLIIENEKIPLINDGEYLGSHTVMQVSDSLGMKMILCDSV